MIQILYQGLEKHKAAFYYWSVFLIRRCSLSLIIVHFRDSTSFQFHSLLIQSMMMLMYVTKYKIFVSNIENFLLIFNEIMIIVAILHMIIFSDAFNLTVQQKNIAGWTFNAIILLLVIVNLVLYAYEVSAMIFKIIKNKLVNMRKAKKNNIQTISNHEK